jgi:uncharacterized protein YcbK (DUF882 family)
MYKYFSEIRDPEKMDPEFMEKLIELREALDCALPVSSAWRSPEHNKAVGGAPNSAHLSGQAVDIVASGVKAYKLLVKACEMGFTGIGIKQHGPWGKRFIHLDMLTDSPIRPRVWTYK